MAQDLISGKSEVVLNCQPQQLDLQTVLNQNLSVGDEVERECRIHGKFQAHVIQIHENYFLSGCSQCSDSTPDIFKLGHDPEPIYFDPKQDELARKRRKFQDECKQIERLIKRPRYPLAYGADNYGKSPQNISDARGFADTIIRTTTTRGCFLTSGSRRARAEFCAFVLRSVRKALVPVLWTDANSIVTDILSTWSDGRQYSEDAMINFYKMTPLLIVDDFGMQAGFQKKVSSDILVNPTNDTRTDP